tara:strand:+ start:553 stop:846 length:294 start_codon:yes stop_codon:yes gene_type:complete
MICEEFPHKVNRNIGIYGIGRAALVLCPALKERVGGRRVAKFYLSIFEGVIAISRLAVVPIASLYGNTVAIAAGYRFVKGHIYSGFRIQDSGEAELP